MFFRRLEYMVHWRAAFALAVLYGGLLAVQSCSVKEDRSECPCMLTLDFSDVDYELLREAGLTEMGIIVSSESEICVRKSVSIKEAPGECVVAVPRSLVNMCAVCGDGGDWKDSSVVVDEGEECPKYYVGLDSFDACRDAMTRKVVLHKNHCILTVRLKNPYGVPSRRFSVTAEGDVCGFDMYGDLVAGTFKACSEESFGGACSVCLPRQRDGLLSLQILFPDSGDIRSFPLGDYILQSGYDWNAPDLEDIDVEVDFSLTGVSFTIDTWKKTLYFEIRF